MWAKIINQKIRWTFSYLKLENFKRIILKIISKKLWISLSTELDLQAFAAKSSLASAVAVASLPTSPSWCTLAYSLSATPTCKLSTLKELTVPRHLNQLTSVEVFLSTTTSWNGSCGLSSTAASALSLPALADSAHSSQQRTLVSVWPSTASLAVASDATCLSLGSWAWSGDSVPLASTHQVTNSLRTPLPVLSCRFNLETFWASTTWSPGLWWALCAHAVWSERLSAASANEWRRRTSTRDERLVLDFHILGDAPNILQWKRAHTANCNK